MISIKIIKSKLIILSLFLLTGFFAFSQQGITVTDSIVSGNVYRKFRIYKPPVYNPSKPAPLIVDLHGYSSNAAQQQFYSNFMPIADTAGFLTVYPEGTQFLGANFWNSGITNAPNDAAFINDLLNYCEANYSVDYRRVYSCGMSNGGIMSYYLACELANRITAIASVTGSMFNNWYNTCNPNRAVPVMEVHGTADATVPFAGDGNFAPVDSVVKKWVRHNNCNSTPAVLNVPDINSQDNSFAVNYRYTGGNNGSSVELYKVFGGSHSWPGSIPIFANTNQDFNASVEIWRFFRQYQLGQFISNVSVPANNLIAGIKVFPNPSSETIYIQGLKSDTYTIFSIDGQLIAEKGSSPVIDMREFKPGIYFLRLTSDNFNHVVKIIKE